MVNVIVLEGKGRDKADFVTLKCFNTDREANLYCLNNTIKGKYWTYCYVAVTSNQEETSYPFEELTS